MAQPRASSHIVGIGSPVAISLDRGESALAFMNRLVSQHGLAYEITDSEDVRNIGSLLLVDGNETTLVNRHPGFVGVQFIAVGSAAYGHQDAVEHLWCRCLLAVESDPQTVLPRVDMGHAGFEQDCLVALRYALL